MKQPHIAVIKQFIDHPDHLDIHSYSGYKGDVVLRFRSSSSHFLDAVLTFCEIHNIETTFKYSHNLGTNEIFIIAEDDVYPIYYTVV